MATITVTTRHRWKMVAALKFASLFLTLVVGVMLFVWIRRGGMAKPAQSTSGFTQLIGKGTETLVLTIPYRQTVYKHFGKAINPQIELPVKTIKGYKNFDFLIDSGAVVSALPKTLAPDLGADLTRLPRITIEGFAGQKTFAYKGEFVIKIGKEEVVIPVVFSENPRTNNILGRIGFFDQFTITFDVISRTITISKMR